MSLMGMKQRIQKFAIPVSIVIAVSMLAGTFMSMGRTPATSRARQEAQAEVSVAKVGTVDVSQRMLDRLVDQQVQQFAMFGMPKPPAEALDSYRLQAIEGIKSQQALVAAAQKAGLSVSEDELKKGIDDVWDKQGRASIAQQLNLDPKASDKEISAELTKQGANVSVESLKQQLIVPDAVKIKLYNDKLTKLQADKVTLQTYKVRHILVKWDGKTTTEAAAKTKAEKLLAEVKATPTKFAAIAKANSDDPGSKDKGGLYEWKKEELAGLVPEFKAAVEKLKAGETTPELVRHADAKGQGYNGFHIIHLDAIDQAGPEKREEAAKGEITKLVDAAAPGIKVDLLAPGLLAAKLVQDGSKDPKKPNEKLLTQALAELDKIKPEDDTTGSVLLRKATVFETLKQPEKAIVALEEAVKNNDKVETRIRLATLLVDKANKPEAIKQLASAEKLALPEPQIWMQLSQLYTRAGDKEAATRTMLKNQEYTLRQQQLMAKEQAAKSGGIKLPGAEPEKK
ncbi:MAG: peptidylprolyl isomerase [Armatimonadetes bacterium]|nr:peptidylprolyl isomerase [Armatimonadota bacterium]